MVELLTSRNPGEKIPYLPGDPKDSSKNVEHDFDLVQTWDILVFSFSKNKLPSVVFNPFQTIPFVNLNPNKTSQHPKRHSLKPTQLNAPQVVKPKEPKFHQKIQVHKMQVYKPYKAILRVGFSMGFPLHKPYITYSLI